MFLQEQQVDLVQHKVDLDYNYWTAGMQKWLTSGILNRPFCF